MRAPHGALQRPRDSWRRPSPSAAGRGRGAPPPISAALRQPPPIFQPISGGRAAGWRWRQLAGGAVAPPTPGWWQRERCPRAWTPGAGSAHVCGAVRYGTVRYGTVPRAQRGPSAALPCHPVCRRLPAAAPLSPRATVANCGDSRSLLPRVRRGAFGPGQPLRRWQRAANPSADVLGRGMLRAAGPRLCRAGTAEGRAAPRIPGLCRSAGARHGSVGSWGETCDAWESLQGKQEGRRQPQPHRCDSKMRTAPRDAEKGRGLAVHRVFSPSSGVTAPLGALSRPHRKPTRGLERIIVGKARRTGQSPTSPRGLLWVGFLAQMGQNLCWTLGKS